MKDTLGETSQWSADFVRSVAHDQSRGQEHSFLNSRAFRDEKALTQDATELVSAQQSYQTALREYGGASTARELPAATMAAMIGGNRGLMDDLHDRLFIYGLEASTRAHVNHLESQGVLQHFGGDRDKLYAYAGLAVLGNEVGGDSRISPKSPGEMAQRLSDRDALFSAALGGGRLPSIYGDGQYYRGVNQLPYPQPGEVSSIVFDDSGPLGEDVRAGVEAGIAAAPTADFATVRGTFEEHGRWATESGADHRDRGRAAVEDVADGIRERKGGMEGTETLTSRISGVVGAIRSAVAPAGGQERAEDTTDEDRTSTLDR